MAPNLFSVSSGFDPWAITLASRPAPIIETMSIRSDLPEPITGDVKACIGAALKLRRLTIVSIAETATALSASPTNGNSVSKSRNKASAFPASCFVGNSSTLINLVPLGSRYRPVTASYPGSTEIDPSLRMTGTCVTPVSTVGAICLGGLRESC
jgi:hypothetical protein